MVELIFAALSFGIGAAISPGPLLALLISETIQSGLKAGCKVALVPLITDLPIILLVFFVFAHLQNYDQLIGFISFCGGCFLLRMGLDALFLKKMIRRLFSKIIRHSKRL
jgi:threonine/homoserine/homoserine lactone efflux protein